MRSYGRFGRLKRGIAAYFALAMLPVMLLSVISYVSFLSKSREETASRIELSLQSAVESIDSAINSAQQACMTIFGDRRVKKRLKPIAECDASDRIALVEIHELITSMTTITDAVVDDIFIYMDRQNVFSDGLYSFEDYFGRISFYEKYDSDFWFGLLEQRSPLRMLAASSVTSKQVMNTRTVVPMVYTTTISGRATVAVTTLSVSSIAGIMRSGVITQDTRMLILDAEGAAVYSELSEEELRSLDTAALGMGVGVALREKCMAVRVQSAGTGWSYYEFVPMNQITALPNEYLIVLACMCLLFGVSAALALYFVERISSPITRMYAATGEGDLAQNAPGLEEISRHVTSFLSDYQETREEEQSMRGYYAEVGVMQLFSGGMGDTDKLLTLLMSEYGFSDAVFQLAVIVVAFDWAEGEPVQDTERLNMQLNFKPELAAFISRYMPCLIVEHRANQYVCLLNPRLSESLSESERRTRVMLDELMQLLRNTAALGSVGICMAHAHMLLDELSGEYDGVMRALTARPHGERYFMGYWDEVPQAAASSYSIRDELRLLSALRAGDAERTRAILGELVKTGPDTSYAQQMELVHELYVTGMRFLAERDETLHGSERYKGLCADAELVGSSRRPVSVEAKLRLLSAFYTEIMRINADVPAQPEASAVAQSRNEAPAGDPDGRSSLTDAIMEYVNQNYASDLYLERIAQKMGLSVKYISKVFKARTGRNLSDYINDVRMEHIRDMLLTTDMSVSAISEAAGIYSRTTLLRLFKKYEGMTPSEYRELARSKAAR